MSSQYKTYFNSEWFSLLEGEFQKMYFKNLLAKIKGERILIEVYPKEQDVFKAFELTKPKEIKAVILGQDPYHGINQAMGLSFSVPRDMVLPPSLRNLYKELESDLGIKNQTGDLTYWAKQGVFLLNTVLTVNANQAGSHQGWGWELFTDKVIEIIALNNPNAVFILLGKPAQQKEKLARKYACPIIKAPHPSPLSAYRGFFGSKIFSKTNDLLIKNKIKPINWEV